MHIKTLLVLFSAVSLSAPAAFAGQEYIVTLQNGNTLSANSYRLEGRKVYLKYPVGEVALSASEVAAVSVGDGSVELLQVNGELKPPSAVTSGVAAGSPQADTTAGKSSAGQQVGSSGPGMPKSPPSASSDKQDERMTGLSKTFPVVSQSRGVAGSLGGDDTDYDPVADSLADQLGTADEKQAMEITKKLTDLLVDSGGTEDSNQ